MCGIAGIIGPDKQNRIHQMTDVMAHRGPDDEGFYHDDVISLGQRRLSIIDIDGGRQPISNEDDTVQLLCNGEIYNSPELRHQLQTKGHKFKTSTDVEVILHLYEDKGTDCVKALRGMFAFALWDTRTQKLVLARDHLGQKPLFYYNGDNGFAFASEVKGVVQSGLVDVRIDLEGLWHYMSLRYLPDRYSLFEGIQKLPAANLLVFEQGRLYTQPYWSLDFRKKTMDSDSEIIEQLDELLRETVENHLLSDVQVGAFLSGGIDSSTVTSMMALSQDQAFPTFSIGVEEQGFNELPYAEMVAHRYGLEPHRRIVRADLVNLIPSMVYHMDEPSDPFGMGVYLVSELASEHVKVVLGGDGGDENFAGYDRFIGQKLVDYYCLLPKWFRRHLMTKLIDLIPESYGYKSLAQKAGWVNSMSFFAHGERYAQSLSILRFNQEAKQQLFTDEVRGNIHDYDSIGKILEYFNADCVEHVIDRMLYTDLSTRMPDHLLALVDRMTMAHSLENRSPLIDYRVVEFAASIPADLKLKNGKLKYLLRCVAKKYLPTELIERKKQGFTFPLGLWMRNELSGFIKALFLESRFAKAGIFNSNIMFKILDEHLSGKVDHNYRLWILINLEIWYRLFFENISVDNVRDQVKKLLHDNS